ncbi:glycosyltransferase family 2 protein [Chitinophaga oryzae]|nr:glycosyltransferase family A protein [Chitinophaga oryzae]QJB32834.1 glycosyltransferase family 2 protein [Chitinophaga oryzae]
MNRLSYLCETLPANIQQNSRFPFVEFVVLNYNSRDGMDDWMKNNMQEHIESGILKYYVTTEPAYFDLSHSKNLALKLASGDIIGMLDADNYAGVDYVNWVNDAFEENGKNTVVTTLRRDFIPYRDQGGKLCFHRDLLHAVNGFDESMKGYGVEDVDLVNRLEKIGGRRVYISNEVHLKFISHSNEERLKNFYLSNNLERLFLRISGTMKTESGVLYLLKDGRFYRTGYQYDEMLRHNLVLTYGGWTLKEGMNHSGSYRETGEGVLLEYENGGQSLYREEGPGMLSSSGMDGEYLWEQVRENDELFEDLLMGYGECLNRSRYRTNDRSTGVVNSGGWGRGVVYKNFDYMNPVRVD